MIAVAFEQNAEWLKLTVKGHAASAPKGEDLVCAAVTALTYTLAQAILLQRERLACEPRIMIREGEAEIVALPCAEGVAALMHSYWVVYTGMAMLAHNFPKYLIVSECNIKNGEELWKT